MSNFLNHVTKLLRRLAVINSEKAFESEMTFVQCQSMIHESGICKQEFRKIDKDWAQDDKNGDGNTIFERFKTYYIPETAILAADKVPGTMK